MTIKTGTHVNLSWLFVPGRAAGSGDWPVLGVGTAAGGPLGSPTARWCRGSLPALLVSTPALWGSCGASAAVLGKA